MKNYYYSVSFARLHVQRLINFRKKKCLQSLQTSNKHEDIKRESKKNCFLSIFPKMDAWFSLNIASFVFLFLYPFISSTLI